MDAMSAQQKTSVCEDENVDKKHLTWKEKIKQNWKKALPMYALSVILLGVSVAYYFFATEYTKANVEKMDQYSHSLWGNDASFAALFKL